jgi:hypothetical protein
MPIWYKGRDVKAVAAGAAVRMRPVKPYFHPPRNSISELSNNSVKFFTCLLRICCHCLQVDYHKIGFAYFITFFECIKSKSSINCGQSISDAFNHFILLVYDKKMCMYTCARFSCFSFLFRLIRTCPFCAREVHTRGVNSYTGHLFPVNRHMRFVPTCIFVWIDFRHRNQLLKKPLWNYADGI